MIQGVLERCAVLQSKITPSATDRQKISKSRMLQGAPALLQIIPECSRPFQCALDRDRLPTGAPAALYSPGTYSDRNGGGNFISLMDCDMKVPTEWILSLTVV